MLSLPGFGRDRVQHSPHCLHLVETSGVKNIPQYHWDWSTGHLHLQLPVSPGAGEKPFCSGRGSRRIQEAEGVCAGGRSTASVLGQHHQLLIKQQGSGNNLSF